MSNNDLITEAEYQELVDRVSIGANRISKAVVGDYTYWISRSIMGRYLKRVVQDYHNARRVLLTVIGKPVEKWGEEDAWCFFDYTISSYHLDNDHQTALRRVYIVRQWMLDNDDKLVFLTPEEIDIAIKMLLNDKQKNERKFDD